MIDLKEAAKKIDFRPLPELKDTDTCVITIYAGDLRAFNAALKREEIKKDTERSKALAVIASLYVAIQRKGWEKGPTISEAISSANDWYYAQFGHEGGAASEELVKIGGGVLRELSSEVS